MPESAPAYLTNGDHHAEGDYASALDRLMQELDDLVEAAGGQLSQVSADQLDAWDTRRRHLTR